MSSDLKAREKMIFETKWIGEIGSTPAKNLPCGVDLVVAIDREIQSRDAVVTEMVCCWCFHRLGVSGSS